MILNGYSKEQRLTIAVIVGSIFLCAEIIGGISANSLAIIADAAHLFTDVFGFFIALLAIKFAKSNATQQFTYGYARIEVFSAFFSVLLLWRVTIGLVIQAIFRTIKWTEGKAEKVDGFLMFSLACIGIFVNICLGFVFYEDHGHSLIGHCHDHNHHHSHSPIHSPDYQIGKDVPPENTGLEMETTIHDIEAPVYCLDCSPESNFTISTSSNKKLKPVEVTNEEEELPPLSQPTYSHKFYSLPKIFRNKNHLSGYECCPTNSSDHQFCASSTGSINHLYSPVDLDSSHHPIDAEKQAPSTSFDKAPVPSCHHDDINMQAAFLHVLTDLIQSIGVAIGGAIIWAYPSWQIADAICSLLFSILVLISSRDVMYRIYLILSEAAPSHLDSSQLQEKLAQLPKVLDVHDVHLWNLSSTSTIFTCHITVTKEADITSTYRLAHTICELAGIDHTTIQIQIEDSVGRSNGSKKQCVSSACQNQLQKFQCYQNAKTD